MKKIVLKKLGHCWVAVTYLDGAVVDWRKATTAEILAATRK